MCDWTCVIFPQIFFAKPNEIIISEKYYGKAKSHINIVTKIILSPVCIMLNITQEIHILVSCVYTHNRHKSFGPSTLHSTGFETKGTKTLCLAPILIVGKSRSQTRPLVCLSRSLGHGLVQKDFQSDKFVKTHEVLISVSRVEAQDSRSRPSLVSLLVIKKS